MDFKKLIENGEFERVIDILEEKTKSPDEYLTLGVVYYGLGKRNKAVSYFKKVLELDSGNVDALFNLAEIYLQLEKYSKAKEYASKLLKISPNDWAAHDILSSIYTFKSFFDRALFRLNASISKDVLSALG